jgi:cystathionine beta-lyase family protein involved in aluminum resistance
MGSLIKNGGGTIVSGGGYVAGRADLVERAVARLTAPGIGIDAGCVPGDTLRLMFQGGWLWMGVGGKRASHSCCVNVLLCCWVVVVLLCCCCWAGAVRPPVRSPSPHY